MKRIIIEHFRINRKIYLLYLITAFVFFVIGLFIFKFCSDDVKLSAYSNFTQRIKSFALLKPDFDSVKYFGDIAFIDIKHFLFILLLSLVGYGYYMSGLLIAYKSVSMGYTFALLNANTISDKTIFIVIVLFVSNMIKLYAFSYLGICSFRLKFSAKTKNIGSVYLVFTVYVLCGLFVLLLACAYEAFILPKFLFDSAGNMLEIL